MKIKRVAILLLVIFRSLDELSRFADEEPAVYDGGLSDAARNSLASLAAHMREHLFHDETIQQMAQAFHDFAYGRCGFSGFKRRIKSIRTKYNIAGHELITTIKDRRLLTELLRDLDRAYKLPGFDQETLAVINQIIPPPADGAAEEVLQAYRDGLNRQKELRDQEIARILRLLSLEDTAFRRLEDRLSFFKKSKKFHIGIPGIGLLVQIFDSPVGSIMYYIKLAKLILPKLLFITTNFDTAATVTLLFTSIQVEYNGTITYSSITDLICFLITCVLAYTDIISNNKGIRAVETHVTHFFNHYDSSQPTTSPYLQNHPPPHPAHLTGVPRAETAPEGRESKYLVRTGRPRSRDSQFSGLTSVSSLKMIRKTLTEVEKKLAKKELQSANK